MKILDFVEDTVILSLSKPENVTLSIDFIPFWIKFNSSSLLFHLKFTWFKDELFYSPNKFNSIKLSKPTNVTFSNDDIPFC